MSKGWDSELRKGQRRPDRSWRPPRPGAVMPHIDRRAIVGVTRLADKPQAFSCKCDQCGAYSGPTAVASSASEIGFRVTCHKCGYVFDLTLRHEHGVPVPDLELMVAQGSA